MESIQKHKVLFIIAIVCLLGTASLIIFDGVKERPKVNTNIAYVEETTESTTTTDTTTTVPTTKAVATTVRRTTKAPVRR